MFFKEQRNQFKSFTRRSFFLLSLKLILFSIIGFRLYKIQINESSKYKTLSQSNRITLKIIYPTRGVIYDRNNVPLVDNIATYNLEILPIDIIDRETQKISKKFNFKLLDSELGFTQNRIETLVYKNNKGLILR